MEKKLDLITLEGVMLSAPYTYERRCKGEWGYETVLGAVIMVNVTNLKHPRLKDPLWLRFYYEQTVSDGSSVYTAGTIARSTIAAIGLSRQGDEVKVQVYRENGVLLPADYRIIKFCNKTLDVGDY